MKPLDLQDIIILMEDSDSEERDLLESALRNVLNNSAEMKKRSREARARRLRLECVHLTVAVVGILMLAASLVALRVALTGWPAPQAEPGAEERRGQWGTDWDMSFPEAVAKQRRIPILWSSVYDFKPFL